MASYTTNEFKSGLRILIDGDPFAIVENEMVKPGKGQAFNRVRIRNLKTGRTIERTFKSGDSVEAADVVDVDMQYLYSDGDFFHFMIPDNFEQHAATKAVVGDNAQWLKDGTVCIVTLWNNVPIVVTPPPHIELKVVETDPGLRGDTATGGQKLAKLETGAVVRVPLFINEGEILKIDTRTGRVHLARQAVGGARCRGARGCGARRPGARVRGALQRGVTRVRAGRAALRRCSPAPVRSISSRSKPSATPDDRRQPRRERGQQRLIHRRDAASPRLAALLAVQLRSARAARQRRPSSSNPLASSTPR